MLCSIRINIPLADHEVPRLRQAAGWDGRESDYPLLLERCLFYAGVRDDQGQLIAFGYICGTGLQHGYLEDVIVHPTVQAYGIGTRLVRTLLQQAAEKGIEIVTVTFAEKHTSFYEKCGFRIGKGGVWYNESMISER